MNEAHPAGQEVVVQEPKSLNPFEKDRTSTGIGAANNAEVHRSVAEVQAAIMLAKQFPRAKIEAMDRILTECCRPTLADAATYSYTRGKEEITGPSIRLAEVIAANWGNFKYGWKETGRHNGMSEIIAFAWDYETNVQSTREFSVRHWRDTKTGGYMLKSERDIYEVCANQAARRMRACILNVIPGDVTEGAVKQCDLTLATSEIVTPDSITKMVKAFETQNVTREHIEKRLGRKTESMTGADMVSLRKIYNGLREGMSRASEFFDVPDEIPQQQKPSSDISSLIDKKTTAKVEPEKQKTKEEPKKDARMDEYKKLNRSAETTDWWSILDELAPKILDCANPLQYAAFTADHANQVASIEKAPSEIKAACEVLITAMQKGFK